VAEEGLNVSHTGQWVVLELSSKADGEDPDLVKRSITYAVKGAEVFIPAAVTQQGEDRVIHYLVEGYAFIRHQHPDTIYSRLENSKYVTTVLTELSRPPGGRPIRKLCFVSDADIDKMRRQIHVETDQGIGVGDTVLITSGAYRQIQARVIEDIAEQDRVQVHIQLRSKDSIITLPRSFLRLVSKAPRPVCLDKFTNMADWFNATLPVREWAPSFATLADVHERYGKLSSWAFKVDECGFADRIASTPLTFEAIKGRAEEVSRMTEWVEQSDPLMSFVRSMYVPLDPSRVVTLSDRVLQLSGWAARFEKLTPVVRGSYVTVDTYAPLGSHYERWTWLKHMQAKLDALASDLHRIERHMDGDQDDMTADNIVIDGLNLAIRALMAPGLGELTDKKGRPSGVIYGFLRSLTALVKKNPGASVFVTWDGSSQRRKAMYAGYKANRSATNAADIVDDQLTFLREVLPLLGVTQVFNKVEEADDVIATLVRGRLKGQHTIILSADRDLLQLVSEDVNLLVPAQGKRKETLFTPALLTEEWGVGPDKIVALRALLGDTSDNLPGVPTVPQKVLTALLELYGSIDGIYASNLAGLTKHRYDCVKTSEQQVRLNFDVMTLQDVPVTEVPPNPDQKSAVTRLSDVDVQVEPVVAAFFGSNAASGNNA